MVTDSWPNNRLATASLFLDERNPRLGHETYPRQPRDIIRYLFEHDKTSEIAESIATRGFFSNEPLLAIKENNRTIVIEGNRRLAALKVLREPKLLEGASKRQIERFKRKITDLQSIVTVPVIIAPNRRITDSLVVGRHIGTAVRPWTPQNKANFILKKLAEGYDNNQLRDKLGLTLSNIRDARKTKVISDMARSLDLSKEVKIKLYSPRANIFTTLERIFDSTVGRKFFHVEINDEHGLRGTTTKQEFIRGYSKLVTDIALGKADSRTLNTNENIEKYFESWDTAYRPKNEQGSFVPSDIIKSTSIESPNSVNDSAEATKKSKKLYSSVLPPKFKIKCENDRLIDIHKELIKLDRHKYPNAGAVLLRVFFELTIVEYLERKGKIPKKSLGKQKMVKLSQLIPHIKRIVNEKLPNDKAQKVEKAINYDAAAPFTIRELNSFVHQASEFPGERDILTFWKRTEPLFKLFLVDDIDKNK